MIRNEILTNSAGQEAPQLGQWNAFDLRLAELPGRLIVPMELLKRLIFGQHVGRTLMRAAVLGAGTWLLFGFILGISRTQGGSMEPTVKDGTLHIWNRLSYRFGEPARGDIVTLRMAGGKSYYLKRILGMPGERVSFRRGVLHINGRPQNEQYLIYPCDWQMPEILLSEGQYYAAGDNRHMDQRRHVQGVFTRKDLGGRLIF